MISDVLTAVVALQEGLRITSPIVAGVTKAYRGMPAPEFGLPGPRVWQNEFTMGATSLIRSPLVVSVHMQFLAAPATSGDDQQSYLIATAFWEALIAALYPTSSLAALTAAQHLGDSISHSLRGADPTVGLATRGNAQYIVAEGYLDVNLNFGLAADP